MNTSTLFCVAIVICVVTVVEVTKAERKNRSEKPFKISLKTVYHLKKEVALDNIKSEGVENLIVSTAEGLLRGYKSRYKNKEYLSFSGIPYAAKPERFQAPKPHPSWDGIRNATDEGNSCMQQLFNSEAQIGSEDCLFLNVHTPNINKDKKAVIVWIHGGYFKLASGSKLLFGPQRFVHQNIVAISINYRLDVLGWLSTGTKHAPGNAGLKDSVEALRWVKRNIENFGGDPDNVCVHGMSSSGVMVDYLTLSPMAKGLFDKAIISSGTALNTCGINEHYVEDAFEIGRILGVNTTNINKLGEILQNINASQLMLASKKLIDNYAYKMINVKGPVIERSIPGIEPFIVESPEEIVASRKFNDVPLMYTMTNREGIILVATEHLSWIPLNQSNFFDNIDLALSTAIPDDYWPDTVTTKQRMSAVKKIKKFYFQDRPLDKSAASEYVDFGGDIIFNYDVIRSATMRSEAAKEPVYFSVFSFHRTGIEGKKELNLTGVAHGKDIYYMYVVSHGLSEKNAPPPVKKAIMRTVTLMANFVKYGDPTPKTSNLLPVQWKPLIKDEMNYLSINDTLSTKKRVFMDRMTFLNSLI